MLSFLVTPIYIFNDSYNCEIVALFITKHRKVYIGHGMNSVSSKYLLEKRLDLSNNSKPSTSHRTIKLTHILIG